MFLDKSHLAKAGDKIKFQVHVDTAKDSTYKKGTLYDGVVIEHSDSFTELEIIDDNKNKQTVFICYNSFADGYESFQLLISEEEFKLRKKEWINNSYNLFKDTKEKEIQQHFKYLQSIDFR